MPATMSAKSSKKGAKKDPTPSASTSHPAMPSAAPAHAVPAGAADAAWIDSADPRKRTMGKIVLVAVWIYVAALWLLAMDQTFHWGIFGPKIPPVP